MANIVKDQIAQKTTTSPTLVAGAFNVVFGQFEKVIDALVKFESPQIGTYIFACSRTIAGNVVTVTIKKLDVTAGAANTWGNAVTADLADLDVVVTAGGE